MNMCPPTTFPTWWCPWPGPWRRGEVDRGIAFCGSGVGASVAVNKVPGARGALITDPYSARQGVEDDDMNIMCLGGRVTGYALAWELIQIFLKAKFKGAERFQAPPGQNQGIGKIGESGMGENPLVKLGTFGQSVWLDYIRRQMIESGELKKLIDADGLKGVTSNPAIFQKAIAGSTDL